MAQFDDYSDPTGGLDLQAEMLQRQLAQAQALRNQPQKQYANGMQATVGGIGDILRGVTGRLRENQLQGQMQDLIKQRQTAISPAQRLELSLKQEALNRAQRDAANATRPAGQTHFDIAQKLGFKLPPGMTEEQAAPLIEMMNKARSVDAEQEYRKAQLAQGKYSQGPYGILDNRKGTLVPYSKDGGSPLTPKQLEDEFKALMDTVSTVKGRANLNAQNQARLYASERVKQIALDEQGNIKNLSPAMITDLAAATAALSSNGHPAQAVIEHFLPKGSGMKVADIQEWLSNEPAGANQMGFIKQMVDLANREEKLIGHQMKAGQLQGVPNFAHLSKQDKKRYESILRGAGLDPTTIDENGLPIQAPAAHVPAPIDHSAAAEWARANPNDPRAKAILERLGGAK